MSALAFKIMTDPFVGSLTFARMYSGVLNKVRPPSPNLTITITITPPLEPQPNHPTLTP